MSERQNIGEILMNFERITEDHVAKAVEYQRENGGYFGEALLAMGFVSQEELEWALASQFDLPYVFPDADTIDPEAAALVSPEWALAHLALPIMKTSESLTVIVDSPTRTEAVDDLQLRTDLRIEIALASAGKIRDLIRQVYARAAASEDEAEPRVPVSVREAFGDAMEQGARRFGISTRGPRSLVWYKEGGRVRRRPLDTRWKGELEELVLPSPMEKTEGQTRAHWSGHLNQNGIVTPLETHFIASNGVEEYLFRPMKEDAESQGPFGQPPQEFLAEVRLLARSGSARFLLVTDPPGLAETLIPLLPGILLEASWRGVHVTDREGEVPEGVFTVRLPEAKEEQSSTFLGLHPFGFDVVSGDLAGPLEAWVTPLLNLAGCAFVLSRGEEPAAARNAAREAGLRWEMKVGQDESGALEWRLDPLRG